MSKKVQESVTIDALVPEILDVAAFARAALDVLRERAWPRASTHEEYLAQARLGVLVGATTAAVEKLVAMIEIPRPRRKR